MSPPSDWELLGRYVRSADHDAFGELVRRHISLVYAIARRRTRDDHLAEDVTQAVMIVLARKANTIARESALASWLFTVTRHASRNALKLRARREFHERRAALQRDEVVEHARDETPLHDILDEAIARLPELDRSGVLLHYCRGQAHEDVATTLGLTLHASRKRVSRALEKMRTFMAGRGVAVPGVALASSMRGNAAGALMSEELVSSTINVALLSSSAAAPAGAGGGSLLIAHGVTRMFTLAKLKIAAMIALVAAGAAGASVPLAHVARRALFAQATTTTLVAAPATAPADSQFTTELTPEISVHFLGVSPFPGDENSWFSIAGQPIELPDHRLLEGEVKTSTPPEHQLAIKVDKPRDAVVLIYIDGSAMASNSNTQNDDEFYLLSRFTLQNPSDAVSIRLGVSTSGWKTVAANDEAQQPADVAAGDYGTISFTPPEPDTLVGGTKVDVHHHTLEVPYRMIAIDDAGKEHVSNNVNVNNTNDDAQSSYTFDLPQDQIKKVKFQVRQIDKWLEAKDISLSADHKTQPKITVTDGNAKR